MKSSVNTKSNVTNTEAIVAGAIAGFFTRFIIAPIDFVKIRMQLYLGKLTPSTSYKLIQNTIKREGVRALWKGNSPAQILYMTYNSVEFASLHAYNHVLVSFGVKMPEHYQLFLTGGLSGCTATILTYPWDYLRTVQAADERVRFTFLETIKRTFAERGPLGFYRGLVPTLLTVFPAMGSFFAAYSYLRDSESTTELGIISASSAAGVISKVLTFPLDTIRKRIQVARICGSGKPHSSNLFVCGREILAHEGATGLYKGLSSAMLKAVPVSALSIFFYEYSLKAMRVAGGKETAF